MSSILRKVSFGYISLIFAMAANMAMFKIGSYFLDAKELGAISVIIGLTGVLSVLDYSIQSALGVLFINKLSSAGNSALRVFYLSIDRVFERLMPVVYLAFAALGWFVIKKINVGANSVEGLPAIWLMMVLSQIPQTFIRIGSAYLYSIDRLYETQIVQALLQIIQAMLYLVLIFIWNNPIVFGVSYAAVQLIGFAYYKLSIGRRIGGWGNKADTIPETGLLSCVLRAAIPYVGVALSVQLAFGVQPIILGAIEGLGAVPAYVASSRIATLCLQLCWRPFDADAPSLQRYLAGGGLLSIDRLGMMRLSVVLSILLGWCITAFNDVFVWVIAKDEYFLGVNFSAFVVFYVFSHNIAHCAGFLLNATGYRNILGVCALVGAVTELALSVVLVGRIGPAGLMLSSAIVNGVLFVAVVVHVTKSAWAKGLIKYIAGFVMGGLIVLFVGVLGIFTVKFFWGDLDRWFLVYFEGGVIAAMATGLIFFWFRFDAAMRRRVLGRLIKLKAGESV